MRNGARGLKQHKAAGGIAWNDSAAKSGPGQCQVIAFVIVTAQGQFKTVLARSRLAETADTVRLLRDRELDRVTDLDRSCC